MQTHPETVLATLPGGHHHERVTVVLARDAEGGSRLELRQQSWGVGVGWFTQSSVQLEPHQVAELRGALGTAAGRTGKTFSPAYAHAAADSPWSPRVVRADSA